ncbi:polysaccharide deacetylase family protein, partial [Streptococcus alactolyticus]|nr:polysaccharide deacetylase family protein [Streptococcus alactolyticus]
ILVVMILCLPLLVSSPKIVPASAAENEDNISITVLNYHKIDDMNISLSVLPADFDRQMAYLKEHGYNTINSQQLYDYLSNGAELPPNPI